MADSLYLIMKLVVSQLLSNFVIKRYIWAKIYHNLSTFAKNVLFSGKTSVMGATNGQDAQETKLISQIAFVLYTHTCRHYIQLHEHPQTGCQRPGTRSGLPD